MCGLWFTSSVVWVVVDVFCLTQTCLSRANLNIRYLNGRGSVGPNSKQSVFASRSAWVAYILKQTMHLKSPFVVGASVRNKFVWSMSVIHYTAKQVDLRGLIVEGL